MEFFNEQQSVKSNFILKNENAKLSNLQNFELIELAVVWSYYSAKIEGNRYTYAETETLLKDNITSVRRYNDAVMLKNLYNTFITIVDEIKKGGPIKINKHRICNLHSKLVHGLVPEKYKGVFRDRPVRITGTDYTPPTNIFEIEEAFAKIMEEHEKYKNPMEHALFLHCNIARLQPFIDGNKRTSRTIESIILMNNDIIPLYSTNENDINTYRAGVLAFYETLDYNFYADYFLNRQIHRLNQVSADGEPRFDLETNTEIKPNA